MERKLENSLRLLEDAVSTPGKSLLRSSHTLRNPNHSLSRQNEQIRSHRINPLDYSITVTPEEMRLMSEGLIDYTITDSAYSENTVRSFLSTQGLQKDPTDELFGEFFEILQMHNNAPQIFETLSDIIQTCTDKLSVIRELYSKSIGKSKVAVSSQIEWLENERNTWRLMYCLYQDRLNKEPMPEIDLIPPHALTEKQCVQNLYKNDSLVRECQLIIDWLERNAADQSNNNQIKYFTDKTVGWENTLHQLKESNLIPFPATKPMVDALDPDAPIRTGKNLHDLDADDDQRLCKQIFHEIRCGRLNEAQCLAVHCGHAWRAAVIEGWRLFHDPNIEFTEAKTQKLTIEGNPKRDLWKKIAWKMSEDISLDPYWRATIGILCGNIDAVLEVCETWEDKLWAYMRVTVDIRVESEIRDNVFKKYVPMPEVYWKNRMSLDEIFVKLSDDKLIHKVQQYVIMDQPTEFLLMSKDWLPEESNFNVNQDSKHHMHYLRFLAHFILVFREFGANVDEGSADNILERFVFMLVSLDYKDYVAFYTATLPQDIQIILYSSFLENITEYDERKAMLLNAEQAGLEVEAITKHVVEKIRSYEKHVKIHDLTNELTEKDLMKISSLDWLMFYNSQQIEAIKQTNSLIRYFLASSKLDGARQAFNKIKWDSVESIISSYNEETENEIQSVIKEFLCYKAYLDAQETFSDWFQYYHNGKPKSPEKLLEGASFTDRVAQEHRESQYNAELERWKLNISHRTKHTKALLYNILLFPEGGWLGDTEDIEDENRVNQMYKLREICVPQVVLLLYDVLHEMEEYKECVQLADIIASENKKLYEVYTKEKLAEILHKISECSLILLNEKKDALGYDAS